MSIINLTNIDNQLVVNNNFINPVGAIVCYAGLNNPSGWLFCNGNEISKITYSQLYNIIGDYYGVPLNSNNFILPNLCGKVPLGKSNNDNLGATGGNTDITLSVEQLPSHIHSGITNSSGVHSHVTTMTEAGLHHHNITDPGHSHSQTTTNDDFNQSGTNPPSFAADSAGTMTWNNINSNITGIIINPAGTHTHSLNIANNGTHTHDFTTLSTGSGNSIDIRNPYLNLNYIIKY